MMCGVVFTAACLLLCAGKAAWSLSNQELPSADVHSTTIRINLTDGVAI
jgi:hypothetical protein